MYTYLQLYLEKYANIPIHCGSFAGICVHFQPTFVTRGRDWGNYFVNILYGVNKYLARKHLSTIFTWIDVSKWIYHCLY